MLLKILVFSIIVNGNNIEKVYYISDDGFCAVEKYFDDSMNSDIKITLYNINSNNCIVLFNGQFQDVPSDILKYDSWNRSDSEVYELKEDVLEISENELKVKRNIGPTDDSLDYLHFTLSLAFFDFIPEIRRFNAKNYLLKKSVVSYHGTIIFSEELVSVYEPTQEFKDEYNSIIEMLEQRK